MTRPTVLVLDPWMRASLAACRALGRTGKFRVGVAGPGGGWKDAGPAAISRYTDWHDELPDPRGNALDFETALTDLVRRRGCDVILATSDATLARLSTITLVVPTFPDVGAAFQLLTDKVALAELCRLARVAYPETRTPGTPAQTRSAVSDLALPAVVKSARSATGDSEGVKAARGATVCWTIDESVAAVENLQAAGHQPIIQARVDFDVKVNAAVVVREDGVRLRYAHRVLRETPVAGGTGVAVETISSVVGIGAEAVDALIRICTEAGFVGLAQAEFYRSRADSELYLVDVNPRLWGSTAFAERLGQAVTEQGVRSALGQPGPQPAAYRLGRRYHTPFGESRWIREHRDQREALRQVLRTTRPWDVFEFVDGRDPVPLLLTVYLLATGRLRGRDE